VFDSRINWLPMTDTAFASIGKLMFAKGWKRGAFETEFARYWVVERARVFASCCSDPVRDQAA
jgi:hypothetical protein